MISTIVVDLKEASLSLVETAEENGLKVGKTCLFGENGEL